MCRAASASLAGDRDALLRALANDPDALDAAIVKRVTWDELRGAP